ncbi:cytochrome-c oxidase [Massilia sp. Root335]|uniref:cytochrome-c oxidase n=1 Tax=Massilia sp. Root335 TaxID=1736517 RepID=UPI0006F51000|nr:cytochrome-c oxidase [Massilia sp. Root335]KQV45681.1 cytochrome c oxidase [Massilia sp. Root335]
MQTTTVSSLPQPQFSRAGIIWLKLAVVYLIVGISLGIAMGASQNFTLRPVHAHINLLGWTTMALAGLIYSVFPKAGESRLARLHFWLLNLALPVMMGALSMLLFGHVGIAPLLAVSEIIAALAIVAFAANLFLNLKQ